MPQCNSIHDAVSHGTLLACSYGAHDTQLKTTSHGWVFGDKIEVFLATGSGPTDGNPDTRLSYRAELSGMITLLYILYKVCQYYNITSGTT
jgi:hypothetical protein